MNDTSKPINKKVTIPALKSLYLNEEKISMITAYDYTMARIVDAAGADIILVGDSLGMVVQGHQHTLPVDIEHMIYHTQCVAKGVSRAHIVADMPFLSYQVSHEEAVRNAGRLLKAGAESIKIEASEEFSDLVWYMNRIGIPVMAHIGLKPQSYHTMGGNRVQGKSKAEGDEIFNDAKAFEEAGAYALLLEGIPMELAQEITDSIEIPTIGIGSGVNCSGQVLVSYDILGSNPDFEPRFVRKYMDLYGDAKQAFERFISDVQLGKFPDEEESAHRNLVTVKPAGTKD